MTEQELSAAINAFNAEVKQIESQRKKNSKAIADWEKSSEKTGERLLSAMTQANSDGFFNPAIKLTKANLALSNRWEALKKRKVELSELANKLPK